MSGATPFVSVLTPTCNRRKFIPYAIAAFKDQTYPMDRMEWIILDDGDDSVEDLFTASGLKNVRYIRLPEKQTIGAKRNRLNQEARGEICVNWDDDDFYVPDRIRKAVIRLRSTPDRKIQMSGSSELLMYYVDLGEFWTIPYKGPTHCMEGTMAFWKTYADTHKYDETVTHAEGPSFLNQWTEPVHQIPIKDIMICICHDKNTYDKHKLLYGGKAGSRNPTFKKENYKMQQLVKNKQIRDFYLQQKKS